MTTQPRRQPRGMARREAIILAARDLIITCGPASITHRRVAQEAQVPLAATTYYFDSLDELLADAGQRLFSAWAAHAAEVATSALTTVPTHVNEVAHLIAEAVLPPGDDNAIRGHYEHLITQGRDPQHAVLVSECRDIHRSAITALLRSFTVPLSADVLVAYCEGVAMNALAHGQSPRERVAHSIATLIGSALPPLTGIDVTIDSLQDARTPATLHSV
ncbi:TetR/AcrR family transcriptional regulator [Jonesia quinghaiensis]|uniref:TetR/AcrR family transcriptional regulator n=1 Tax=Jonesia quinghaiensis TaxID=262806 RepID=UPI00040231F2|nr:TetR family transcriptional regulator [Jonesia quinghaiensis]